MRWAGRGIPIQLRPRQISGPSVEGRNHCGKRPCALVETFLTRIVHFGSTSGAMMRFESGIAADQAGDLSRPVALSQPIGQGLPADFLASLALIDREKRDIERVR
jgi:hypothetical protein